MKSYSRRKIVKIKMGSEFFPERSKKIKEDAAKWTLIYPKIWLEYLCMWPETESYLAKVVNLFLLFNVLLVLVAHTAYFIEIIQDVVQVAEVLTTVNVCVQALIRMITLITKKKKFQAVLNFIYHESWSSSVLKPTENDYLKKQTKVHMIAVGIFVFAGLSTTPQFAYQPLLLGLRALPLMVKLPFSFLESPTFELLYVWECCISLGVIQLAVIGFDILFMLLVWNCSAQFQILRMVLGKLVRNNSGNFGNSYVCRFDKKRQQSEEKAEVRRLVRCIQYHQRLIQICNKMEDLFKYILLFQLLDSALSICVCCFAAVTVPMLFAKMVTFGCAYLMQLLMYCAFGNELLHQSTSLAYAAFESGWQYSNNLQIRKLMLMLMQRSQEGKRLTARGFAVVNYTTCLKVIKMAFSFYTMLDALKKKREY